MAQAYTSARGKNKKGKLGDRKDSNNNAANKLSQKMFAENPLEFLSKQSLEPKGLGNSATARKREALEKAREKLNLLLTGACGSPECPHGSVRDAAQKLLVCKGCNQKAYCDAACQKADWKAHKEACKAAAARKAEEAEAEKAAAAGGKKGKDKEKEPLALTAALAATSISQPAAAAPTAAAASSSSSAAPAPAAAATTTAPAAAASAAPAPAASEGDALD